MYDNLIKFRKDNKLPSDVYTEKHHILPRCMGGDDTKENLVRLTPEEHFFCHKLLCKIHPEVSGLRFALISLTWGDKRANNKLVGHFRRLHAKTVGESSKERWKDPEYRDFIMSFSIGRVWSDDVKEKISKSVLEYYASDECDFSEISETMKEKHKSGFFDESYKKISEENKGRKKPDDFGARISKARMGMKFSDEHKENLRNREFGNCTSEDNPMNNPLSRDKVSKSKIGRKKVILKSGKFIMVKKEDLYKYTLVDGKYYE
jgi:hypothetical protein